MLKIVIVDDEKNVRIVIKKLLSLINIVYEIVGEAASVSSAKEIIEKEKPDIVLLDIELEDGTGFDLLNQLTNTNFKLIFITAFNEYAIKAFKFNALDYILKPIDPSELETAISKAKSVITSKNELQLLLQNLENNKNTATKKLVIKTTQKTHFITVAKIRYFQSDGSYTKVIAEDLKILASKNLKYFQEILPENQFIRPHLSFLVNKFYIKSLQKNIILLDNNVEIPISVRRRAEIKKLLSK